MLARIVAQAVDKMLVRWYLTAMQRRAFLQLVAVSASAASLSGPLSAVFAPQAGWNISNNGVFPGALLTVQLDAATPAGAQVHVIVRHAGVAHDLARYAVAGEETLTVETPYPFATLVKGDFAVELHLRRANRLLQSASVGTYRVTPWRFSV